MNQSRLLLGVLLLSLFSFGLFQISSSFNGSAVLGDSTISQPVVAHPDAIPCQVIIPIINSYCADSNNWLICKTLDNVSKTYCP